MQWTFWNLGFKLEENLFKSLSGMKANTPLVRCWRLLDRCYLLLTVCKKEMSWIKGRSITACSFVLHSDFEEDGGCASFWTARWDTHTPITVFPPLKCVWWVWDFKVDGEFRYIQQAHLYTIGLENLAYTIFWLKDYCDLGSFTGTGFTSPLLTTHVSQAF